MKTVLFQGDSITDAGRDREQPLDLGRGYPAFAAARLGLEAPNGFAFLNRGVGGDRSVDLYARVKADILNLSPDAMSILVGVNDVWHELDFQNGIGTAKYQMIYKLLLDEVLEAMPQVKLLLMEPFVGHGAAVEGYHGEFRAAVEEKARVVRDLAEEYGLRFLPLQKDLDELEKTAPCDHWTVDGVHPTIWFHQYIADRWLEVMRPVLI